MNSLLSFPLLGAMCGLVYATSVFGESGDETIATASDASEVEKELMREAQDVDHVIDIPFSLESVPEKAEFDLSFQVKTTGICPGPLYRPTSVRINGKSAVTLNFRDAYEADELVSFKFKVKAKKLKLGENTLRIRMGSCMKGADSMRLNGVTLRP